MIIPLRNGNEKTNVSNVDITYRAAAPLQKKMF